MDIAEDENFDEYSSDVSTDESEESELTSNEDIVDEDGMQEGRASTVQAEIDAIEGDFNRLIENLRTAPDVSNNTILSKIWDRPPEYDADEQFRADLRAASGIGKSGKGKGKGRRRGRSGPALSHEVRALIGEGNTACVEGNLQEAIRIMTEVIRIEPRATSPYTVLAICYRELGDRQKALTIAIFGAHLRHDADEWHSLARESKELGLMDQALVCLTRATKLNPDNLVALWDRAMLAQELENLPAARSAYLALLKRVPHDTRVLAELRHILVELGDLQLCADLYQDAFDHYTSNAPADVLQVPMEIDPSLTSPDQPLFADKANYTLMDILVLADLYNTLGRYEQAVKAIRAGCRWLQGRAEQRYWDACPDDREFDPEGFVRNEGHDDNTAAFSFTQGNHPLDVNARHRLAIARLKAGDIEEGQMHASIILSESIEDYAPLFTEIADVYFERAMYAEARPLYEMLGADAATSNMHVLMRTADCRHFLEAYDDAMEVYEYVISADPSNNEAKIKLAEIYELKGQARQALDLVYQVIDSRKRTRTKEPQGDLGQQDAVQISQGPLFNGKKRGKGKQQSKAKQGSALTHEQLVELEHKKEAEALEWYKEVKKAEAPMRSGDEDAINHWLLYAEKLVEMFRETRKLFPARGPRAWKFTGMSHISRRKRITAANEEAEEENMASRLELELDEEAEARKHHSGPAEVHHFRGIHFEDWLTLAMEYAFVLTRHNQYDLAEEVLRHLLLSRVFESTVNQDQLRLAIISCALYARRHVICLEMCRNLMFRHQFNNEPYRIFLAVLASGLVQTDQMINTNFQKFVLREGRTYTGAVEGTGRWSRGRYGPLPSTGEKQAAEEPEDADMENVNAENDAQEGQRPTKYNPVLPTIHAQSLIMAKSYQGGIFHLLHAYDYCPNDPVICLTLAVASLGRAMQRQADNRNFLIVQAFGFLTHYREMRRAGSEDARTDEVEYNYGRAFQQIGLYSHAIKHYERALSVVEKRIQTNENDYGVAREAAYNLSIIYVIMKATHMAREVRRRWLSF